MRGKGKKKTVPSCQLIIKTYLVKACTRPMGPKNTFFAALRLSANLYRKDENIHPRACPLRPSLIAVFHGEGGKTAQHG